MLSHKFCLGRNIRVSADIVGRLGRLYSVTVARPGHQPRVAVGGFHLPSQSGRTKCTLPKAPLDAVTGDTDLVGPCLPCKVDRIGCAGGTVSVEGAVGAAVSAPVATFTDTWPGMVF